jgi:uncharacterized protein YggE
MKSLLFVSGVVFGIVALQTSALAAPTKDRDITVSGACTREAATDRAALTLTADFQETDLNEAVQKATRAYTRASEAIKKLDLPDAELKTTEYSVTEVRNWEKDKSVFV